MKNITIRTLVLLSLTIQACTKQLNRTPGDQVDGNKIFTNVTTLNQGVLGVYATWNEEYWMQMGAVPADECRIGLKNAGVNGSGQQLFRWTPSTGDKDVLNPWVNAYQVIAGVNNILNRIGEVPVSGKDEETRRNALKGELLAIRAFLHFELYRVYAYAPAYKADAPAVPYVIRPGTDTKPSRPETAAFFAELEQDLADAATLMNGATAAAANNRMTPLAIQALEARVALYKQDWARAVKFTSSVISQLPLADATSFPAVWTDQSDAEVIFKLKRTNQSALRPGDIWMNAATGIQNFAPATKLMALYDAAKDIRYQAYFNTDPSQPGGGQLADQIRKFAGPQGAPNLADVKVFRTAEMYLIRAEALAQTGDAQDAAKDLNALRTARIAGYTDEHFSNTASVLAAIATERYKELAFEGHRFFDLRRTRQGIDRSPADLPAGVTQTQLTPQDAPYYIPIPQAELLVNPNIAPNNPGW